MKTKTVSQLKKQADKVFSEYIRRCESDSNGIAECVTCGKRAPWKELQNGHYITRGENALRYNERNCSVQCWSCNAKHFGNGKKVEHALYLEKKYGAGILQELHALRGRKHFSRNELQELIDEYTKKVLVLKLKAL